MDYHILYLSKIINWFEIETFTISYSIGSVQFLENFLQHSVSLSFHHFRIEMMTSRTDLRSRLKQACVDGNLYEIRSLRTSHSELLFFEAIDNMFYQTVRVTLFYSNQIMAVIIIFLIITIRKKIARSILLLNTDLLILQTIQLHSILILNMYDQVSFYLLKMLTNFFSFSMPYSLCLRQTQECIIARNLIENDVHPSQVRNKCSFMLFLKLIFLFQSTLELSSCWRSHISVHFGCFSRRQKTSSKCDFIGRIR